MFTEYPEYRVHVSIYGNIYVPEGVRSSTYYLNQNSLPIRFDICLFDI